MEFNKLNAEKFSNEITYNIINSKLRIYPFPHSENQNILPVSLLNLIDKNFPKSEEFISHTTSDAVRIDKDLTTSHPYDFRYQLHLTKEDHILRIQSPRLDFWKFFNKLLTSPLIIQGLLGLYDKYLQKRFGEKLKDKIFYPDLMLLHDKNNYSLGPHTDIDNKVAVLLIYLETDIKNIQIGSYGTSIYVPKENGFICNGGKHHKHKDFYKIYTADFKKNNSLSFFRTNNSFHGVETVNDKPIERRLLQLSIKQTDKLSQT